MKVLVLEDEAIISMLLEDMLLELGHTVVGPAMNVPAALSLIDAEPIDAAILDVNVGGVSSAEVADLLDARGIPFAFATGYASHPGERFQHARLLQKPYSDEAVRDMLESLHAS